jgi:hypothetical protein
LAVIGNGCSKPETTTETPKAQVAADVAASKWEKRLVRRPGTSAEDGKVYLVQEGKKRWVVSGAWLKEHGYKWPDDVSVISAQELDSIPSGDPIQ